MRNYNIVTITIFSSLSVLVSCGQTTNKLNTTTATNLHIVDEKIINEKGKTLETRFNPPIGFERTEVESNSFAWYLRQLPLKPTGAKVKYYNGELKNEAVYEAVVDMEITNRDLQQCADAIMRLRGEYFYSIKSYDKISFTLTNGFKMDYTEWMKGNRLVVNGNKTSWLKKAEPSNTHEDFRKYMDIVFTYAGTLSLSKSMHIKNINNLSAGDIFILGGSPGHAVIVVDVAENKQGEKIFMIAQSYMPAQETQILKNNKDINLSPWYSAKIIKKIYTPQWTFDVHELKTW